MFDVVGTTVQDSTQGGSLIIQSFCQAFHQNGISVDPHDVNKLRGKSKKEAVMEMLQHSQGAAALLDNIYNDFIGLLKESGGSLREMEGVQEVFKLLKKRQIRIGLGSGLPLDFLYALIERLQWNVQDFDYIGSSEELSHGRPHPAMIFDAMEKLNEKDKTKVLKVGDTVVDVQEGKNAGVNTACVLTGTQKLSDLKRCHPDYILRHISELPTIL